MQLNAIFHRKEPQFNPVACTVDKIIEMESAGFQEFQESMLKDQSFIIEFNDRLQEGYAGPIRCLLLLGQGYDDGILIDTQGYDYARYTSFVPGARQLLAMDQLRAEQIFKEQISLVEGADPGFVRDWMYHARARAEADSGTSGAAAHHDYLRRLREFGNAFERAGRLYPEAAVEIFNRKEFCMPDQLLPAAEYITNGEVEKGLAFMRSGIFIAFKFAADKIMEGALNEDLIHHDYSEVQGAYGLKPDQMPQLIECLQSCAEVEEVLVHGNRAAFTLCLRPQRMAQDTAPPLDQGGLTATYARHLLWELGQPDGVRADFSGQVLSGLDFEGMSFRDAIFTGADIRQCRLGGGSFEESDFYVAFLRGVSACETEFIDANFNCAVIDYCSFANSNFDGSSFTSALIRSCDFEDSQTEGVDFSLARLTDCTGLDDIAQGPAMMMGGGM
jgi:hypothetical protein